VVVPAPEVCSCCGSDRFAKLGEDVTETLEVIPRRWKVIQTVREKFTCRDCEKISQAPAPFHVTPRGWAGPSLLAMILFEKYGQHQPLNRQSERYAREGVELSLSTLADAAERIHGDDTTVPVLAKGKADTARAWVYVRDDAPFGGADPPAALFCYSRDRSSGHPEKHLKTFSGILQADAYAGYNRLYEPDRSPGPVTKERRAKSGKQGAIISPLAFEAVQRIDALFDIEREINGMSAEERLAVRAERSAPLLAELEAWMREERARLSRHAPVAKAMDYMLKRWPGFSRFLDPSVARRRAGPDRRPSSPAPRRTPALELEDRSGRRNLGRITLVPRWRPRSRAKK
jgi:transposase